MRGIPKSKYDNFWRDLDSSPSVFRDFKLSPDAKSNPTKVSITTENDGPQKVLASEET